MAEAGKGPAYTRMTDEGSHPEIGTYRRRIDHAFEGKNNEERRLVLSAKDRVHYGLGVLGLEEDFETLDLDEKKSNAP